jgi:MbtH protein
MTNDDDDTTVYKVVVNHEEQYSVWPAARDNPAGWRDAGKQGRKAECLAHIKEIWTDMRPLSLRRKMEQDSSARGSEWNQTQGGHGPDS